MAISEIPVSHVAEEAIVHEEVVGHLVAVADEVADRARLDPSTARIGIAGGRRLRVGEVTDEDPPQPVMADPVVNHGVVLAPKQLDADSYRCVAYDPELRHVGIIVVMDVVVADHRAGSVSRWALLPSRASPVLRRGPVVVVGASGEDTHLVLIPFAVLNEQMTPGIGTRKAQGAVLCMTINYDDIAVSTRPDIERRIAHIARVVMVKQTRTTDVAGEEAVESLSGSVVLVVGRAGGQVRSQVRPQANGATAIAAVEPDLVAVVPAIVAQEVAHRQVLHRRAIGLQDLDAVASAGTEVLQGRVGTASRSAGQRAIHDHAVAVHASDVKIGSRHQHAISTGAPLVVVAWTDKNPVPRTGGIHRRLNRLKLSCNTMIASHAQHMRASGMYRNGK